MRDGAQLREALLLETHALAAEAAEAHERIHRHRQEDEGHERHPPVLVDEERPEGDDAEGVFQRREERRRDHALDHPDVGDDARHQGGRGRAGERRKRQIDDVLLERAPHVAADRVAGDADPERLQVLERGLARVEHEDEERRPADDRDVLAQQVLVEDRLHQVRDAGDQHGPQRHHGEGAGEHRRVRPGERPKPGHRASDLPGAARG